jgi:hypothetical protein
LAVCWESDSTGNARVAYFGYNNTHTAQRTIAASSNNVFNPSSSGAVTTFTPGVTYFAARVDLAVGATATWTLDGFMATIATTDASKACPNTAVTINLAFGANVVDEAALKTSIANAASYPEASITLAGLSAKRDTNYAVTFASGVAGNSPIKASSLLSQNYATVTDGTATATGYSVATPPAVTPGNAVAPVSAPTTTPTPTASAPTPVSVPSPGFSGGAIAGIVIGSILAAVLVAVIIVLILTNKRSSGGSSSSAAVPARAIPKKTATAPTNQPKDSSEEESSEEEEDSEEEDSEEEDSEEEDSEEGSEEEESEEEESEEEESEEEESEEESEEEESEEEESEEEESSEGSEESS